MHKNKTIFAEICTKNIFIQKIVVYFFKTIIMYLLRQKLQIKFTKGEVL